MEETVRSDAVVKKKSSSGCVIIRKKDERVGGSQKGGIGSLQKNKKKRPRVISNDSESGDELPEPYKKRKAEEISGNSPITYQSRAKGNGITESDTKRSRLDLFEFDEYDEFDERAMRDEYRDGRLKVGEGMESSMEFRNGYSGEMMVAKRKFESSRNALGSRTTKGSDCTAKSKIDQEEDEADLPISMLKLKHQKTSNEAIRLQGKNGVLKVMVNKKMDLSHKKNDCHDFGSGKGSTSEDLIKKKLQVQPTIHSDFEHPEKQHLSVQREKSKTKSRKTLKSKNTPASDSESDGTGTSTKVVSALPAGNSLKRVKKEENKLSTPKVISPTNKEGKTKRGASTEKQKLREKIRGILTDAGWTIDYRPRRNRDYLDAVYMSPCGTAYWSIVKAYDAFQKHLEEDGGGNKSAGVSAPFSPLSEDINKLTRQTRKKMEREMKKKRKDHGTGKDNKKDTGKESAEGSDSDQHDERLSSYIKKSGKFPKGKFHTRHQQNEYETSENISISKDGKLDQDIFGKSSVAPTGNLIQGRKSKIIGRCTLLVRSSEKGQNSESDGYVPYSGKRTLLAWMIDSGTAKLSEKVQYMNRRKTRVKLEGWITRDGIHCGCCSKILTVSKFELHAGSKLRQPFQNIVLESGVSLLQCLIDAWNRQEESERQDFCTVDTDGDDPDDDTCGICGDGGDLICCDSCPSTFHQSCLGIMMLPPGDWHCPNCICKFCGIADESPTEDDMGVNDLHLCILCEKKYHKLCRQELKANNALPVKNKISSTSFCGQTCHELYDHLRKIIGVKHELEAGYSWSLIQRTNLDSDTSPSDFPQRVECNSKLAVALSIMDECFLPIVDRRSEINIIHNVLYNCGSNFSRLSYRGFYTAILEKGDEIISAASIRIHGTQLAEMPFIGTRHIYRRQGMCRRLLSAIETVLSTLKVEKLIIPAISEHIHTWTVVFGFNQLEESHKQEMKSMNMLVFPGVDMLQKQLVKQGASEGLRSVDLKNPSPLPTLIEKSDTVSCTKHDANTGLDNNANEIHAKVESGCSGSPASAVQSHNSTMIDYVQDHCPSAIDSSNKVSESIKSEADNKLAESSTNLGHYTAGENVSKLDKQDQVLDTPEKITQSSVHLVQEEASEKAIKTSCSELVHDSSDEAAFRSTTERDENQDDAVLVPAICGVDKTASQLGSESSQIKVVENQGEACSIPEASPIADVLPTKDEISDSAPTEVDGKEICADSSLDLAIQCNNTEEAERKQTSQSTELSAAGKPIEQFSSDPNHHSTIVGENEPHMASEKTSDTKGVDSENIEGNKDLASSGESKNVEESCVVEPPTDFTSKTSSQDTAAKDGSL